MENKKFHPILLIMGVVVALLVVIVINSAFIPQNAAHLEPPVHKVNELVHYTVPNLIFYLF